MHDHDLIADQEKTDVMIKDHNVRRALTRACHLWFFRIYFAHYITYKTAAFQKELFAITENEIDKNIVIEAFRGSGKTTIMGTSYAIWSILGIQKKKFVLIIAKTESQARQYLANIKIELENNKLLRADLGPFEEPNDEWRAVSIVLPNYEARITVASIESSIRGIKHGPHRPQLIICDDLEDLDIVKTQESRDKLFKWFTGDIAPIGEKETRRIVIGTRLHNDSLLARLRNAIMKGDMQGIVRAYPFLDENGDSLWSEKYPTAADIEALKKSVPSPQAWEREYMLNIVADDDQVIREEWIRYYDILPEEGAANFRYAATGIDPAISEKETADCTAMVSGRVYGRSGTLKIYILPNPVNDRMDFPKTLTRIKELSIALGGGIKTSIFVEGVAYQKALIDQLQADGFPAKEWKPQGTDKRARLSLVSSIIQSGQVLFPRKGAEALIAQMIGFGTERHDDLADAFCILIQSILEHETLSIKGYHPLFTEKLLDASYADAIPMTGERRIGVVLAGPSRPRSVIILRSENAAQVMYDEPIDDPEIIATKIIEFAKLHEVPIADEHIFVDEAGRGRELCELITKKAVGNFHFQSYENKQYYGTDLHKIPLTYITPYADTRSQSYWRLEEWLGKGGKLLSQPAFDDLLHIGYADQNGKTKIVDKEKLSEHGIDSSIPDALMLTIVTDKNTDDRFMYPEGLPPLFPSIGI